MSTNFGTVDVEHLPFPVTMSVDWIRVYQRTDSINYGCDPDDFPTSAYIQEYVSHVSAEGILSLMFTLQIHPGLHGYASLVLVSATHILIFSARS